MTLSTRHGLFGASWLGITLMFAGVIGALVDHSRQDMTASHLVLIPFVTAVLVFQGRATIFASVETAWRRRRRRHARGVGFVRGGRQ